MHCICQSKVANLTHRTRICNLAIYNYATQYLEFVTLLVASYKGDTSTRTSDLGARIGRPGAPVREAVEAQEDGKMGLARACDVQVNDLVRVNNIPRSISSLAVCLARHHNSYSLHRALDHLFLFPYIVLQSTSTTSSWTRHFQIIFFVEMTMTILENDM